MGTTSLFLVIEHTIIHKRSIRMRMNAAMKFPGLFHASRHFQALSTQAKSRTVRYQILRPHQLPLVQNMMYESFHPHEPIERHLGLYKGSYSIPDADKLV